MQSLALDVKVLTESGDELVIREFEEEDDSFDVEASRREREKTETLEELDFGVDDMEADEDDDFDVQTIFEDESDDEDGFSDEAQDGDDDFEDDLDDETFGFGKLFDDEDEDDSFGEDE